MAKQAPAQYRDREEWLAERRTGIGGSDAAAILGLNPYKTPLEVWMQKTGEGREIEVTPAMERGIHLEPVAADLYTKKTGRRIRRQPLKRHPDHDFILGNVDRQILTGSGEGEFKVDSTGVLEIKCPGLHVFAQVKSHGLPEYMTIQLLHYLGVYGYDWGSFALFNAERWELIWFDLEADPDLIQTIIDREVEFWTQWVVPKIKPGIEPTPEDLNIPEVEGELTIRDTDEWIELAENMREARSLKDTAAELEDQAKEKIQELMHRDELHAVEVPDIARFYYKPYPGNTSWKKTAEAIAKEAGLDPDNFVVKGNRYTRFTPYFF